MTALSTSRVRGGPVTESERPTSASAQRALRRRRRRQARMASERLGGAGRPVRSALIRVPFAVALIAVLGGGVGGVLYLNTKTDESGLRTVQAREDSAQLRLEIEALGRSIAALNATPRIAAEARELGLVPAGDAAILVVGRDGKSTLIGTPSPAGQHPAGATASGGGH
jgi:hypothetical protein